MLQFVELSVAVMQLSLSAFHIGVAAREPPRAIVFFKKLQGIQRDMLERPIGCEW